MISIAVIGMGTFGESLVENLAETDVEIIIIDKDRDVVEKYKDITQNTYITDVLDAATLNKIIPEDIDAVVVDLGSQTETAILVTNELKKMNIKQIVVKASTEQHGEILKLVGATMVVFPDKDSAQRITPLLVSSALFDYMQISPLFGIAEVRVKPEIAGKTLLEAKLRQDYQLNAVAYRSGLHTEFQIIQDANFKLNMDMRLLVAGTDEAINAYIKEEESEQNTDNSKNKVKMLFNKFFGKK